MVYPYALCEPNRGETSRDPAGDREAARDPAAEPAGDPALIWRRGGVAPSWLALPRARSGTKVRVGGGALGGGGAGAPGAALYLLLTVIDASKSFDGVRWT